MQLWQTSENLFFSLCTLVITWPFQISIFGLKASVWYFFQLTPKTMLILCILLSALTTSSRNLHWHMSHFKVLPQKMKLNPQLYQRNLINWMITTMQKNVITGAPIYDEDPTWTLEDVDEVYTKLGDDCDDKKQTTNLQYVWYSSSLLSYWDRCQVYPLGTEQMRAILRFSWFCPEHTKWDQNPRFKRLSETSIPAPFICESPLPLGKILEAYQ